MTRRKVVRLGGAVVAALTSLALGAPTVAQEDTPPDWTSTQLEPADRVTGSKAPTSRIAQTSPELLGRTDATVVDVVIKLDYDSVATYDGSITGLDATSPAVTGTELTGETPAETAYEAHVVEQEQTFEAELAEVAPAAAVEGRLRTVYGGVVASLPANEIEQVLAIDNVVAVQVNQLRQTLTDASSEFIGADPVQAAYGADRDAGKGVIFGVLDTGAWPEHPSFADQGHLASPPAKADGTPRACDFGDNPLTPAVDVFECNNKLIGGQAFLDAYLSSPTRAAAEPYHTARDSNGHGTHTGSTSAGNVLESAPVFGVDRGPINGVAPGAWVSVYKVCGIDGCFDSDSAAAVGQAILDGVDVINFSISGGTDPASDPVELAFLDAYAAGIFVSTSGGNDGPGAGTVNHLSPWTTTVAASTQTREFRSTLTLTAGANTATFDGASITAGAGPAEVVLASAAPYSRPLCDAPAPAGSFAGKIVACQRGTNARVEKGYNVLQGGAVGMILYNPTLADTNTDNHWLPTVHLADGTEFLAFMTANPGATATFTGGEATDGQGDVMAAFSSRGPAGNFIKPDVSAPGVQILAGHTPTPESFLEGPPGEYFQAIAGTSMSSPHVAGSAVLLAGLHPDWTPGQIKSALMTTATRDMVKEDLTTPADPFDRGSGRIRVNVANNPGVTFDATAEDMVSVGLDPLTAVHLNQPSINAPIVPGRVVTTRTARNVSGRSVSYDVRATSPTGSVIEVSPRRLTIGKNRSATITITITTNATEGQYFGEINLVPRGSSARRVPPVHIPVAFQPGEGAVTLTQDCDSTLIARRDTTTCTVTAQNQSFSPTTVNLTSTVNNRLRITDAEGARLRGNRVRLDGAELTGVLPGIPAVSPGATPAGPDYLPMSLFAVPYAIGDEEFINFNVPAFVYAGKTYSRIGINSNGYVVVGGGTSEDNNCCNPSLPDPARPNNIIAPFWTDLDGTGAPGVYATTLTDGVNDWIVVEWAVNVFGTTNTQSFQVWIGVNGVEDVSIDYDQTNLPGDPNGQPFVVGAEGESGQGQAIEGLPTQDLRVVSSDPAPGGSVTYTFTVRGQNRGAGNVHTEMTTPAVTGVTIRDTPITVV